MTITVQNPITFFLRYLTKGDARTVKAKRNISVAFFTKSISIIISFLIIPLTLGYVGKVEYGIWMTISSIINWFSFFDIGLGNGLRNKLAESIANDDHSLARIYISSALAIISLIAILMFIAFLVIAKFVSWNAVLNTDLVPNNDLYVIITSVFFFFCISFAFNLISSILQATQHYDIDNIIALSAQLLGFIALFLLTKMTKGSLFLLCLIYGSKSALVLIFAAIILFRGTLKAYRPNVKYIQVKKVMPLLNLGFKFFLSQIFYIIVTQSSVMIVVQLFGPEDVTIFNIAVRYITITSMVYMMILTPFLSAFTEAFTKREFLWISKTIKKINIIWIMSSFATILLVLISDIFFKVWLGNDIAIPKALVIALALSSIINTWSSTFTLFLNGVGKIQLQLLMVSLQALLLIPLTYLFYLMNFGLISIVIAQTIFYTSNALIFTIQYKKIINHTALGLWAK